MAERDINRKLSTYRALYGLNLSFAAVVEQCGALGQSGALPKQYVDRYQSFAQELQAQINEEVTDILQGEEAEDLFRFGKVRDAFEKSMRDPDDVFILAEERRKELARQGKTPPNFKTGNKKMSDRKKTARPRRKPISQKR